MTHGREEPYLQPISGNRDRADSALVFAATPPHPANIVDLLVRRAGGPPRRSRALAAYPPPGTVGQRFSVQPPLPSSTEPLEYRAELMRVGQRLAAYPADGSWLPLYPSPPAVADLGYSTSTSASGGPTYDYACEYFATFEALGRVDEIGATPEGYRIDFLVAGGWARGPDIDGEILPGGGDWFVIRPDGVAVLDIHATCRTTGGALISYQARGLLDLGPDGYARAVAGQLHGTPPCVLAPTFQTADPTWQWLNRAQGMGVGRVLIDEGRVCYDVHLPRVAG